jgi:cytochrome c
MRVHPSAALITALCLAACGKPSPDTNSAPGATADTGTSTASASSSTTPAPTATAGPTDAQKKAILATLPAAYQNADLDNGQAKFALCQSCHTVGKGEAAMTGPNLWGVFGRKAGTAPGFAYSDGVKALGVTWDAPTIDKWISNPRAMVPGTKMTYLGMENAKDRADVVAYLKVVTSAPAS